MLSESRTTHRFEESWWVAATPQEAAEVLVDLATYPDWWPQVVAVAALGDDRARVLCRSRLPYVLDLVLTAVTKEPPTLEVAVEGDLEGWVRFDLTPEDGGTRLDFRQEVEVRGWLGLLAGPLRAPMHWNHHQMMRGCRDGLAALLATRATGRGADRHEPSPRM